MVCVAHPHASVMCGCFQEVVPGCGREGTHTLTLFQTPPNRSVPPSCTQTGGFSGPVNRNGQF